MLLKNQNKFETYLFRYYNIKTEMVYTKGQCREILRGEIVKIAEGRSLKKFSIQKQVEYNGKKYDNREGLETGKQSGMWRLGTTIEPCEGGYVMTNWTIVGGSVTWNAEVRFNSKMTCQSSHINTFMGSPLVYNGNDTCNQYLSELLEGWGDGFMKSENGWTFH
tara:strand:- start:528 stop:1019 length:492 start_codon:yes stop_codon:yes gene_type:complete